MTSEAMNHIQFLIKMANDFLNNKIDIDEFVINYEDYLEDYVDKIFGYNHNVYEYLNQVRMGIAYYEPDPEIRDHPSLIDENELRKRTKSVLDVLASKYNLK